METFNDIIQSVIDLLSQDEQCDEYRFVSAFPDTTVENPVGQGVVSIGIASLKITQSPLGEVVGHKEQAYQIGRQADCKLQVHIYVPRSLGGKGCYDVFSGIAGALLERQDEWMIGEMTCGQTSYNRDTRTFGMECFIELTTLLQIER